MNSEELINKIFDAIADTSDNRYIFMCEMKRDFSHWSKQAVKYFDLPGEYMYQAGKIWEGLIHPDDRKVYRDSINNVFSGRSDEHNIDARIKNREGNYVMCTCKGVVIRDNNEMPLYFAGSIVNHGIQESIDSTTNLYNLYTFLSDIDKLKAKEQEARILFIGITNFNEINATYDYSFGNSVLKYVATELLAKAKGKCKVYRLDGTKFGVYSTALNDEEVAEFYNDFSKWCKSEVKIGNINVSLHLCAGLVDYNDFSLDSHAVYSCARYAYTTSKTKENGELVMLMSEELKDYSNPSLKVATELRKSILNECDGYYINYQPIISADKEEIKGMEALLRWKKEPVGDVPPAEFIPWLESDPLFMDLGFFVIRKACEDTLPILKKYPRFKLHLNLSYAQLENRDFRSGLLQILSEINFPPTNLCFELTERCKLLDMDALRKEVLFFKSKGIAIAIDNFGTGFTSLNLLRELPMVDIIKVDRKFIKDIEESKTDQYMIDAIITVVKKMGVSVCIEGIENKDLKEFMKKYDVSAFQGYYFSKPCKIEELKKKYI